MIALLQALADRVARAGVARRDSAAERTLADADQAWRLVSEPPLWQLWMPGVGAVLDPPRPLRPGARYRVRLRPRHGRLGFGAGGEGYVQVERADRVELAWQLIDGSRVERYAVRRGGATLACSSEGGDDAAAVLALLDRETRPLA